MPRVDVAGAALADDKAPPGAQWFDVPEDPTKEQGGAHAACARSAWKEVR